MREQIALLKGMAVLFSGVRLLLLKWHRIPFQKIQKNPKIPRNRLDSQGHIWYNKVSEREKNGKAVTVSTN
jgi:hypothetical protein